MPFQPGQSGNPAGLKKGTRHKINREPAAHAPPVVALPAPSIVGPTPLQVLCRAMNDEALPWRERLRAAADAAPYVHAKQPQAVHVSTEARIEAVTVEIEAGPWLPATPTNPAPVEATRA